MGEDQTSNTHKTPAPATKQSQWEEVAVNGFQDPSTLPTPVLTDKQRRQAKQIFQAMNTRPSDAGNFLTDETAKKIYDSLKDIVTQELDDKLDEIKSTLNVRSPGAAPPRSHRQLATVYESAGPSSFERELDEEVIAPLHYIQMLDEIALDGHIEEIHYLYNIVAKRVHKDELLDPIDDDDHIDYSEVEIPWESNVSELEQGFKIPQNANKAERDSLINILDTFNSVFSKELNEIPADLDPLQLKVDDTKWKIPSNRAPTRFASELKREEIKRQVDKMLKMHLIQTSQTPRNLRWF
jgi:hypothetical protein